MNYEFKKLGEVEALSEVPENANALIEVDGSIKRVPGSGLGGATGIKTAIIRDSSYTSYISEISPMASRNVFECINMTFEEAYETLLNGEPLAVFGMIGWLGGPFNLYGSIAPTIFSPYDAEAGPALVIMFRGIALEEGAEDPSVILLWTSEGIESAY